jgi:cytidylate kinase
MIIGLTGYAQSGKDTVAKILVENYGYTRVAFADKIREFLYETNPMYDSIAGEPVFVKAKVDRDGWEVAKQSPHIRHKDDEGHEEDPGTRTITEFAFAHAVKEKLQKPGCTGYGCK